MKRALTTDRRWRHILRVVDETLEDYLTGLVALRRGGVADLKRKLTEGDVRDRLDLEQKQPSPRNAPASTGRHPRTPRRRLRG